MHLGEAEDLLTTESQMGCPTPPLHRAYPIGAYVGSGLVYSKDGSGTCVPANFSPVGDVYALGAEVDPTALVAATEGIDP
jgi:hypothetical protein